MLKGRVTLPICLIGVRSLTTESPMEYSLICQNIYAISFIPVRNKLFVFCIMLSLWVYMLYYCVGYCSSVPSFIIDSPGGKIDNAEVLHRMQPRIQNGVQPDPEGLNPLIKTFSRDLLNNENEIDSRADDWEEMKGEQRSLEDSAMSGSLNGSETKKLPQAIIIGVKKGGTRALLEFLRVHPDIRAVGAEPHFFDRNYDKGLEWYR